MTAPPETVAVISAGVEFSPECVVAPRMMNPPPPPLDNAPLLPVTVQVLVVQVIGPGIKVLPRVSCPANGHSPHIVFPSSNIRIPIRRVPIQLLAVYSGADGDHVVPGALRVVVNKSPVCRTALSPMPIAYRPYDVASL